MALELFYKFVKCWTRAKRLVFLHKRQVEYGGLCNNKPILPGFVWYSSKMASPHKVPLSLAKSWYFTSLAQLQMYSCVHSRNIRVYTVDLHSSFEWIRPRSRASSTSTIVNTQECTQSCEPTPVCWQVRQLRNLRKMIRKMVQLGNSAASTPKFS